MFHFTFVELNWRIQNVTFETIKFDIFNKHFPNLLEWARNNSLKSRRAMKSIVNLVVFIASQLIREVSINVYR